MSNVVQFPFQGIRIYDSGGQAWFDGEDVCRKTQLPISSMLKLDADERGTVANGNEMSLVVTQSGLFALILMSDSPDSRAFRKWVTAQLLPMVANEHAKLLAK